MAAIVTGHSELRSVSGLINGSQYRLTNGLGRTTPPPFSSLAGRKAIFLLALISIASPVAGFLPIRAARFRTWRMPRPCQSDFVTPLEVPCDQRHEVTQHGLGLLLGDVMAVGQRGGDILQCDNLLALSDSINVTLSVRATGSHAPATARRIVMVDDSPTIPKTLPGAVRAPLDPGETVRRPLGCRC
jgi:hypothetical protein